MTQVAIYGCGGFGREVAWLIEACNEVHPSYEIVCFVDDDPHNHGRRINDIVVLGLDEVRRRFPEARIVTAVGTPQTRQSLVEKASAAGLGFETIVHPRVERSRWIQIGEGTVICAGCILTTNIVLGRHVHINLDCTVGHDAVIGDFGTLAPGVHVSGWVHFGRRVYVGTGAVIINGTEENPLTIGDDVVIGAGACVTKPVPAGLTVAGVPAKPLERA